MSLYSANRWTFGVTRIFVSVMVIYLGFSSLPASAAAKQSMTTRDMKNLCIAATTLCLKSCQEDFACEATCHDIHWKCMDSIPVRKRNQGATGTGTGGKPPAAKAP